ncbi:hypothetical protein NL676_037057 [Syzygium grande]|nr:hypothetical protein NL676_037057 [Syzygium grande]
MVYFGHRRGGRRSVCGFGIRSRHWARFDRGCGGTRWRGGGSSNSPRANLESDERKGWKSAAGVSRASPAAVDVLSSPTGAVDAPIQVNDFLLDEQEISDVHVRSISIQDSNPTTDINVATGAPVNIKPDETCLTWSTTGQRSTTPILAPLLFRRLSPPPPPFAAPFAGGGRRLKIPSQIDESSVSTITLARRFSVSCTTF